MNILHEMSVLVGEVFIGLATFNCFDQRLKQNRMLGPKGCLRGLLGGLKCQK